MGYTLKGPLSPSTPNKKFNSPFQVPKRTRARYEMLMGDAHVIQGNLTESRKCYYRALKHSDDKVNFQGKI